MKQKFLLATIITLCFAYTSKAQIGKGSVWLGGNIGFSSSNGYDDTSTYIRSQNFNFNPGIGKAISENTILGIDLAYAHSESKAKPSYAPQKGVTNFYGAGIFIRRYVPIISRLYIFGQARAGVSFGKITNTYSDFWYEGKDWLARINFYPGVSFAVNKKLQLETGFNNLFYIQYEHANVTNTPLGGKPTYTKANSFTASASIDNNSSFYIGFRLLLNNKG